MELIAIVLTAILAWLGKLYFDYQKELADQKRLLTVIYGELLNVQSHYLSSSKLIPNTITQQDDMLPVEMSIYGSLSFTESDLTRLGFLTGQDVARLIQLSLMVRNTDLILKYALDRFSSDMNAPFDLKRAKKRMNSLSTNVSSVINELSERNPMLKDIRLTT